MLLDQAGVFVVSGGHECEDRYPEGTPYPEDACIRSNHDHNSPCSDADLDYHAKMPPHRPNLGTVCYDLEPDFEVPGADKESSIQSQYDHMVQRATRCSQQHDFPGSKDSDSESQNNTTTNPMFGKDVLGVVSVALPSVPPPLLPIGSTPHALEPPFSFGVPVPKECESSVLADDPNTSNTVCHVVVSSLGYRATSLYLSLLWKKKLYALVPGEPTPAVARDAGF